MNNNSPRYQGFSPDDNPVNPIQSDAASNPLTGQADAAAAGPFSNPNDFGNPSSDNPSNSGSSSGNPSNSGSSSGGPSSSNPSSGIPSSGIPSSGGPSSSNPSSGIPSSGGPSSGIPSSGIPSSGGPSSGPSAGFGADSEFSFNPLPPSDTNFVAPSNAATRAPQELLDRAKLAYRNTDKMTMFLVILTIAAQVLGTVIIMIMRSFFYTIPDIYSSSAFLLASLLPMYIIAYPVILWMFQRIPSNSPRSRSLGFDRFFKYFIACFPIMYIGNIIGNLATVPFGGSSATDTLDQLTSNMGIIQFLLLVVLAPVFEELIFRKSIIDRVGRYGEKTAIVLSGLIFALFHMNLLQFFYAFGLGMLFAYIYINTGRIRYTIALHMGVNFVGTFLTSSVISTVEESTWTLISQYQEGVVKLGEVTKVLPDLIPLVLFYLLVLVLCICGIIIMISNRSKFRIKRTSEEIPSGTRIRFAYGNVFMIVFTIACLAMMLSSLFM